MVVLVADGVDRLLAELLAAQHPAEQLPFVALRIGRVELGVEVVARLLDEGLRGLGRVARGEITVDVDDTVLCVVGAVAAVQGRRVDELHVGQEREIAVQRLLPVLLGHVLVVVVTVDLPHEGVEVVLVRGLGGELLLERGLHLRLGRSLFAYLTGRRVEAAGRQTLVDRLPGPGPIERRVDDKQGRSYLLRLRPYKSSDNRIDGAVIALFDLDAAV